MTDVYKRGVVVETQRDLGGAGTYLIRDSADRLYDASYADILTDGFRTLRVGEQVRFVPRLVDGKDRASYILRLSQDDEELFYAS